MGQQREDHSVTPTNEVSFAWAGRAGHILATYAVDVLPRPAHLKDDGIRAEVVRLVHCRKTEGSGVFRRIEAIDDPEMKREVVAMLNKVCKVPPPAAAGGVLYIETPGNKG